MKLALPSTGTAQGMSPLRPRPARTCALPMALLCEMSCATALYYARTDPASGYFMTHVRLFELGAGGLMAVRVARGVGGRTSAPPARLVSFTSRTLAAAAGLATIGASGFLYTPATPFPGAAALVPVLGTVAVVVTEEGGGEWARPPPLQFTPSSPRFPTPGSNTSGPSPTPCTWPTRNK